MQYVGPVGSIQVAELDWGNHLQAEVLEPPFDYIVGTDLVCKFASSSTSMDFSIILGYKCGSRVKFIYSLLFADILIFIRSLDFVVYM